MTKDKVANIRRRFAHRIKAINVWAGLSNKILKNKHSDNPGEQLRQFFGNLQGYGLSPTVKAHQMSVERISYLLTGLLYETTGVLMDADWDTMNVMFTMSTKFISVNEKHPFWSPELKAAIRDTETFDKKVSAIKKPNYYKSLIEEFLSEKECESNITDDAEDCPDDVLCSYPVPFTLIYDNINNYLALV
jgi:hypothetical protein